MVMTVTISIWCNSLWGFLLCHSCLCSCWRYSNIWSAVVSGLFVDWFCCHNHLQ